MIRSERFEVDPGVRVEVDLASVELEVRVGAPGVVAVDLDVRDPDSVEIERVGSSVIVRGRRGRAGRRHGGRVSVEVPEGSDLEARSAAGSIRTRGPLGSIEIHTASADVRVEHARRLRVATATGEVDATRVQGPATCTTVSGRAELGSVDGPLEVTTTSGSVLIGTAAADTAVRTVSGDVDVDRCDGAQVALRSVSGDLAIGLPSGTRVDAELITLSGRTSLPEPGPPDDGPRRPVRLVMRSVSGDLTLHRRS